MLDQSYDAINRSSDKSSPWHTYPDPHANIHLDSPGNIFMSITFETYIPFAFKTHNLKHTFLKMSTYITFKVYTLPHLHIYKTLV